MTILHDPGNRTLPHNLEAEKSVLGAILINNTGFAVASAVIEAADFFRDAHRRIFAAMQVLVDRNEAIDLVTIKDELIRSGELEDVGGPAYVGGLTDGVPRSANVEYYAKIVKEKSTLRRLIQAAKDTLDRAYDAEDDAASIASDLGAMVGPVADGNTPRVEAAELSYAVGRERIRREARRAVDAEEAATVVDPPLLDDIEILELPDQSQLVEGVIVDGSVGILTGAYGTGKTPVALALLCAVATGGEFFGRRVGKPGPAIYIAGEGGRGIKLRLAAQKVAQGLLLDERIGIHIHHGPLNLIDPHAVDRFIHRSKDRLTPNLPRVVIADTSHSCMPGMQENDSDAWGMVYQSCRRIRDAFDGDCTVLLVHHPTKDGRTTRGSGSIEDDADVVMCVGSGPNDTRQITCRKQKDAAPFEAIGFELSQPSPNLGIAAYPLGASGSVPEATGLTAERRAVFEALETFGSLGATTTEWLTVAMQPGIGRQSVSKATFYRARTALVDEFRMVRKNGHRYFVGALVGRSQAA